MLDLNGSLAGMWARARQLKALLLPAAAVAICLAGSGCSSGTSTASQFLGLGMNTYLPAPGSSLQSGEVTLYIGSIYLGANMSFGQLGSSGNPVSFPSGVYNVYSSLIGSNSVLAQADSVGFGGNNTPYTIVAAGANGQTGVFAPQVIVMPNYTNGAISLASGQCAIRVVNLSLNPHPLGLYATANLIPTTPITTASTSVSFGYNPNANPYQAVSTASLVKPAIVDTTAPTVPLAVPNTNVPTNLITTTFSAGSAYTLVIYGQPGNTSTYNQLGATWI